jgi:hypothetical protein
MTREEEAVECTVVARWTAVHAGLEPLGSEVLIEGSIAELGTTSIVLATASMLPVATRAFIVLENPGDLPVVGLVEVDEQRIVVEDVSVELRLRFVQLSPANAERLSHLIASSTSDGR